MEKKLLKLAKRGEAKAISTLYQENIREVYRFIYYKVGNREDAEDVTQDVFIAAFASLKTFRGESSFRNWCYEIAKHKIADLWREKYRMPTIDIEALLGLQTSAAPALSSEEVTLLEEHDTMTIRQVASILDRLKGSYREVLEYRFLKNYSIKETAEAMGISVNNAKVLQHRALKKAAEVGNDIIDDHSFSLDLSSSV